jgi:AbrB family looped-hinge helix DNA binding protein
MPANSLLLAFRLKGICDCERMKSEPVYRVKFSTHGRVTIPAPLRKKYGIKGGSKVALEVTPSGAFLLKPVAAGRC